MQIVIDIPDAPMKDYQDLYWKIHGMAASEGLFDDKKPSERAKALGVILKILIGITNGTPLPKGHGRLIDADAMFKDICNSIEAMTNIGIAVDGQYLWEKLNDALFNASTIIEADKAESEE